MCKIRSILMGVTLIATQQIFAQDLMGMSETKPCATIAKACMSAGFTRANMASKNFWFDCMKPIILAKSVSGVTIDPSIAKSCRMDKIQELKMELNQLQNAN